MPPVTAGDGVNTPPVTPYQGLNHFGLTVKDIDAVAAEIKAKGVEFTSEPTTIRPGVRIRFIRGPQGISIELLRSATRSTPELDGARFGGPPCGRQPGWRRTWLSYQRHRRPSILAGFAPARACTAT